MSDKVRAEFFVDPKREDSHRYIITIVIGDGYWQRMRDLTKAEALSIAERINSDPAEIAEKAKKEYAEGETERRTAIHGHGCQLGVEEGKRLERERIEGIIAQMEKEYTAKMIGIPHAPDFMAALSELKSAIAEE